ncbi:PREDICTED: taste receptor type 2 member 60 [Hipposideros armiger]|uniref:Taste receptor type 2 n=1 Tax=Hipposideros armiger TaxID=186990 RepID=A0A8B7QI81_HIPAR|nr:PREDICTED: taste receptor type 2 member 60 [Hipposideros armiger]
MNGDDMVPGLPLMDERAIILAIILFLLCLVALVGNGFITAVLGMEWWLRRTLSPCDQLLVSLGASRFCLQWVVVSKSTYVFLYPKAFPYNPVLQLLAFQWDFWNAATLWVSSWLSVFYCVKIATLTHPVFLRLKRKVPGLVPRMLLSSVGFSSLSTILFCTGNHSIYQNYLRRGPQSWNLTGDAVRRTYEKFYFFPLKIVTWTLPTTVFLVGMVLLITSLGRHAKKSFLSTSGSRDPRSQAHIKALLAITSFTILFTSSFLSLMLNAAGVFPSQEFKYWVWQAGIYLCTAVHPIILLMSNPRLRAVLARGCFLPRGAS